MVSSHKHSKNDQKLLESVVEQATAMARSDRSLSELLDQAVRAPSDIMPANRRLASGADESRKRRRHLSRCIKVCPRSSIVLLACALIDGWYI